ncbi:MAG: hypothetical protein AAGH79_04685 [Bacteroidota bacterium]
MAKSNQKISFQQFLEIFPELELPVTLTEETSSDFGNNNEPFPALMIDAFLTPLQEMIEDPSVTEYIPCFRIPDTYEFHAVIYWKASLLTYQYAMATFTKKGELIDHRIIAGTYFDGKTLTQSVATVDKDWTIYVVSGQTEDTNELSYDASTSKAFNLELLPDGNITDASPES